MSFRSAGFVALAVSALTVSLGCSQRVNAEAGLSQAEAERVSANIYIANCHPPQPGLTRTVVLGQPNPAGRIREQYGAKMVYPIQVTWTGSCAGHPANPQQTDHFAQVQARYTANYYQDQFGNWAHTPFIGTCRWVHDTYQPSGSAPIAVPGAHPEACSLADTIND